MEEPELKKCSHCCRKLPLDRFGTHVVKGVETVYSKCATFRPKHAASSNTSANKGTVQKKYNTSAKGKATAKRANTSEKGKARAKRARTSEKGKAGRKRAKKVYNRMLKLRRKLDPEDVRR
jgi:hypothetical protein